MTQEDKELLLKDLCARLPYYPKCEMIDELRVVNNEKNPSYVSSLFPKHIELFSYHNNFTIKPYLRPMSSMTDEELIEFLEIKGRNLNSEELKTLRKGVTAIVSTLSSYSKHIDWLNKYHFDYRGLIPLGLAIEVTEDNNPYK